MWKLLVCLLKCQKSPYVRAVKVKGEIYIVHIEKYESAGELESRLKKALDAETSKAY